MRISAIEARRADIPDSVGTLLDHVRAGHDSLQIRAAVEGLRRDPERWERVWATIVKRLQELEENPTAVRDTPPPNLPAQPAVPRVSD